MRVGFFEKFTSYLTEAPAVQGVLLAVTLALLRVWRDDRKADWAEAFTCGLLAAAAIPAIAWAHLPAALIVPVGATIGHVGARRIRGFMSHFLGNKTGAGPS